MSKRKNKDKAKLDREQREKLVQEQTTNANQTDAAISKDQEIASSEAEAEIEIVTEGEIEPQIALSDYNALEAKHADLQEQLLRVSAEYDNFRRRTRKEKQVLYDDATAVVVKAFLPVLDNMDRALASANKYENEESKQVLAGLELIYRQAQNALKELQVTETDGQGQAFDPDQHIAVMHVEDENLDDNVIKEVLEKGYRIKDKVIRHSSVIVAN